VHFSGLDDVDKFWMLRVFKAFGFKVAEKFSKACTHLLCPSGEGPKCVKALEWGTPIVNLDWAGDIARAGALAPVTDYLVSNAEAAQEFDEPAPEMSDGGTMTDITNSEEPYFRASELLFESTLKKQPNPAARRILVAASTAGSMPASSFSTGLPSSASFVNKSPVTTKPTSSASSDGRALSIPSSTSPSPLKIPPGSFSSPPVSAGSASALKDTIASLLGKRPSSEDAEQPLSRPIKKTRQLRRTRSRQDSRTGSGQTSYSPHPLPQFSQHADGLLSGESPVEESMRVTYLDPVQRDEQRRLMSLLGDDNAALPECPPEKPVRTKSKGSRRASKA